MLKFQIKKDIKTKRYLIVFIFALLLSIYTYIFLPNNNSIAYYDLIDQEMVNYNISAYFDNYNAPEELQSKYDNEINAKITWGRDEDYLKQIYPSDQDFIETKMKVYQNQLDNTRIMRTFLNENMNEYPELSSSKNKINLSNIDWTIFKLDYLINNKAEDPYKLIQINGDNAVQKLTTNSTYLFGIIPILFFILFSYDLFSKERESNSLNLLYTQPSDRRRILFSKYISIILAILLYVISILVISSIIFYITKVPFRGFNDLYRIFDLVNPVKREIGIIVISKILAAFAIMAIFWSTLGFILGTVTRSNKALAIVLSVFAILYVVTENISLFQQIFNPIYSINIFDRLYGAYKLSTDANGLTSVITLYPANFIYYSGFFILSIFIVILASLSSKEVYYKDKVRKENSNNSLFKLELRKIINNESFVVYFLGVTIVIASLFLVKRNIDIGAIKNFTGDNAVKVLDARIASEEKVLEDYKSVEYKNKLYKVDGKEVNESDWDEQMRSSYDALLDHYRSMVNSVKKEKEDYLVQIENYNSGNTSAFYEFENERAIREWDMYAHNYSDKVNLTDKSKEYNTSLYEKAKEVGAKPVFGLGLYISPYENFVNKTYKEELIKNDFKQDHDAFYFLYKMLRSNHLDIIILFIVVLMALPGFTNDKDNGNQFEFINLQPYSSIKILFTKILSQLTIASIIVLSVLGFTFLLGGFSSGFGMYNYPVGNYSWENYEFMSLWIYLTKVLSVIFLLVLFITSLSTLISIFVKKLNSLYLMLALVFVIGMGVTNYLPDNMIAFSPFTYLKANIVADNSIMLIKNSPNINYINGVIVLLVSSMILNIISSIINSRREIAI